MKLFDFCQAFFRFAKARPGYRSPRHGVSSVITALVVILATVPLANAQNRELTPEVRAALFSPTSSVSLARRTVRIPLNGTDRQGHCKCPYVQVYVNGRGPFTFLYDTGAAYTLVSSKVVEAAQPPIVFDRTRRDVVNLAHVKIGGVTLKDVWAVHDDDFGVDGILGFPAFGTSNVLIDFSSRLLTVSATPIRLSNSFELPYQTPFNVPTVPLTIGVRTIPILIDTGDDAFGLEMRRDELGDATFAQPPVTGGSVLNGANVQQTSVATLVQDVGLGPVRARAAFVGINDSLPVGDIGYDVLRQFRVQIEPKRRVAVFQPLFAGNSFELRGPGSSGFSLSFGTVVTARGVKPGSNPALAGMADGDRIVSIDGRPSAKYTVCSWGERIERGTPVSVRWIHDGVEHKGSFPIRRLH